jgi:hypothetical protein
VCFSFLPLFLPLPRRYSSLCVAPVVCVGRRYPDDSYFFPLALRHGAFEHFFSRLKLTLSLLLFIFSSLLLSVIQTDRARGKVVKAFFSGGWVDGWTEMPGGGVCVWGGVRGGARGRLSLLLSFSFSDFFFSSRLSALPQRSSPLPGHAVTLQLLNQQQQKAVLQRIAELMRIVPFLFCFRGRNPTTIITRKKELTHKEKSRCSTTSEGGGVFASFGALTDRAALCAALRR